MGAQPKTRLVLDCEVWCPLSGLPLSGGKIKPHKMMVYTCVNGALFAKCSNHLVRCFISDRSIVAAINGNYGSTYMNPSKGKTDEKEA